jgi:TRAP-type mannitol/chloroaromatic compound transport system substrate-binding protein
MQTGVIDAFESSNPYANYVNGYADITKYWGFPGMHNTSQTSHMLINLDCWKKLPPDLQKIVELAANMAETERTSFAMVESAKILPVLAKKGIEFIYEGPDIQLMWRNMMLKSANERAKKDPTFLTELNKALEFQYMMDAYIDLQNPVYDSTYPGKKENIPGFIWK